MSRPDYFYRSQSSAWTGLAPRHAAQRWPAHPVSYTPTAFERLRAALGQLLARVHGQPDNLETPK